MRIILENGHISCCGTFQLASREIEVLRTELIEGGVYGIPHHLILANFAKDPLKCRQAAALISRVVGRKRNLKNMRYQSRHVAQSFFSKNCVILHVS